MFSFLRTDNSNKKQTQKEKKKHALLDNVSILLTNFFRLLVRWKSYLSFFSFFFLLKDVTFTDTSFIIVLLAWLLVLLVCLAEGGETSFDIG